MLNIGEFARLGQVSPRMLRHYDELRSPHARAGRPRQRIPLLQRSPTGATAPHRGVARHRLRPGADPADPHPGHLCRGASRNAEVAPSPDRASRRRGAGPPSSSRSAPPSTGMERHHGVAGHRHQADSTDPSCPGLRWWADPRDIGAAFGRLMPEVIAHLEAAGAKPASRSRSTRTTAAPSQKARSCCTPVLTSVIRRYPTREGARRRPPGDRGRVRRLPGR